MYFRPNFTDNHFCGYVVAGAFKGSFSLPAWNRIFFVCFVDFFASLNARLDFKRRKINKKRMLYSTLVVETSHNGPFPLRAWKRAFFVCSIDFFCARFNFNRSLESKINKRNKEYSFPRS